MLFHIIFLFIVHSAQCIRTEMYHTYYIPIYAIENFPQYRTHIAKKEKKNRKAKSFTRLIKMLFDIIVCKRLQKCYLY